MDSIEGRCLAWLESNDRGVSSQAIYEVMTGRKLNRFSGSPPLDIYDFGRCVRLLDRFPEWRKRMGEMLSVWPASLVFGWEMLEAEYRKRADDEMAGYRAFGELLDPRIRP